MSAEDLCSTLVGWFRNRPEDVLEEIARQSNIRLAPMRRMDPVSDATLRRDVPMAAQRLIRWSTVGPEEIFRYGFQPRIFPGVNQFPEGAYNLRTYVAQNHDSIFVSTSEPYINDAGRLTRWERRVSSATYQRFEYEIFAYGGIDVNRALGVHAFDNQHEIAFAGGIRPEMIRSAREYAGTQIIRIWENTHFDNTLNPPGENPPLGDLPRLRHTPSDAQVRQFPGPDDALLAPQPDQDELRRRRAVDGKAVTDDDDIAMYPGDDGDGVLDSLYDTTPVPQSRFTCMPSSADNNQAYFFCGNRYVRINVNPGGNDTIAVGPYNIVGAWPSLWKAGFSGGVDAVLPHPSIAEQFYVFCVDKYVRIHVTPGEEDDYIVSGPTKIVDGWPSLKQAGFERIDACMLRPSKPEEAYFFSGTQYVRIKFTPGSTDDTIITGPHSIVGYWPSLKEAGFDRVKAILPNPVNKDQAYFFSGDKYAVINIAPGTTNDTIVRGPYTIHSRWGSFTKAGFW